MGIFLTPYLMLKLGAGSYGLIALAGIFTLYAGLVTNQIAAALNRFLSIEIQKNGGRPNVFFSSALIMFLGLCLVQIPVFAALIYLSPYLFNIPAQSLADMYVLLVCTAAGFLLNLFGSVYMVPVYAKNRLDVLGAVNFCLEILRVVLIVAAFVVLGPKLRYVGYAGLIQAVLTLAANVCLCKRYAPEIKYVRALFDFNELKPVFKMSGWTLLNSLGNTFYNFTAVWIINRFISVDMAGIYAAIMIIPNALTSLVIVGLNNLMPIASTYYARGELELLYKVVSLAMKLSGVFFAVPLGFIFIFAGNILAVWLGPDYACYGWMVVLTMLTGIFTYITTPLYNLRTVLNKVKVPGLVFCLTGALSLTGGYIFGVTLDWGVKGVIIANITCLAFYNWVFSPWYAARIMQKPAWAFFKNFPRATATLAFACAVSLLLKYALGAFSSWPGLIGYAVACEIIGLVFIWLVMFNGNDRRQFYLLLPAKISKIFLKSKN